MAQPILAVMRDQGRRHTWLAERINYSAEHISRVFHGSLPASADFRRECARVLGMDEALLFADEGRDDAPESRLGLAATR